MTCENTAWGHVYIAQVTEVTESINLSSPYGDDDGDADDDGDMMAMMMVMAIMRMMMMTMKTGSSYSSIC